MAPGLLDLRGLKKDGTEFPADISLNPLESDTGTWVVAAIRDLTELRRAQQQTLRAQRLESIGRLAGGVAHDLNNALAPIVIATEMLYERYPDSTELLDTVSASAKRAADMVKQLLTYARGVEGARRIIQPQQLLKEMEKIIRSTFPKDIELRTDYAPNLQPILGDATQLQQVLLNLCVNARDVMPRGGTLTLAAENVDLDAATASVIPEARPGRYVVWRVTDTGPGIPPGIVDRIFEPFFSTKGPAQGTGLGLSTAVGIVKSHGGLIRVSSPPGQGATFEAFLPVSDASAA
jgi:signal transduction histidine kinase